MERHFQLDRTRLALLPVNKTLLFNQDNMGLCRHGGYAEMVTDFLVCRRIAAGFDEVFDKIEDFLLSLRDLFQSENASLLYFCCQFIVNRLNDFLKYRLKNGKLTFRVWIISAVNKKM